MKKFILGIVAATAVAAPLALASSAYAETPSGSTCTPSKATKEVTHTEYQWAALVAKGGLHWEYKWTATPKNPSTDIFHVWLKSLDLTKRDRPQITRTVVDVTAHDAENCAVTLPQFEADCTTTPDASVFVPFTPHVQTRLAGVQGYSEDDPITQGVTVTRSMASQFWLGYTPDAGYVAANAGQLHIDFNASCPAPAEEAAGAVSWVFNHGEVTGTVNFNASNKTGGTLDYQASNGMWLHGVVTAGSYQKIDDHTAVFAGEITSGSDDYTVNHDGTDYFTVKVVDGGTSGDIIAVLANMDGHGNWLTGPDATTTRDYPMTPETAGIVTGGNLTVH